VPGADPTAVSSRAVERGPGQVGSLGSGNDFLEVQAVDGTADPAVAEALDLRTGWSA
jgi:tRNA-splicing ligase RtcB